GKMQVTNRLETPILWLAVVNEDGKFFAGEQLADDSRTLLEPITREAAVDRFAQLEKEHPLEAPPELAGSDRDLMSRRARGKGRQYARTRPEAFTDPMFRSLASEMIGDLAGLNGRLGLELPPRSYVAVTATGPEVEIGI